MKSTTNQSTQGTCG